MKHKSRSKEQIIEEHVRRWQLMRVEKPAEKSHPVITVSREPGSGGSVIAKNIADKLGFDLFRQEVLHTILPRMKPRDASSERNRTAGPLSGSISMPR